MARQARKGERSLVVVENEQGDNLIMVMRISLMHARTSVQFDLLLRALCQDFRKREVRYFERRTRRDVHFARTTRGRYAVGA